MDRAAVRATSGSRDLPVPDGRDRRPDVVAYNGRSPRSLGAIVGVGGASSVGGGAGGWEDRG